MAAALARRQQAGPAERDAYASYINEAFLTALEKHGQEIVFQFSLGAEPLPFETGSRLSQRTIAQLAEILGRHPKLRFQAFLSSRHANQSLCIMARELPNLSLAGYWWHNFFPDVIRQVMSERLDMLPVNKQVGFFSDAYVIEWTYGKALLVRRQMAQVLAQRIEQGQYSRDEAMAVARAVLYETPQTLLGMVPRTS
jgi:glucuronate isomerase